jgi:hypothetical protein
MLARMVDFGISAALLAVLLVVYQAPLSLNSLIFLPGIVGIQLLLMMGLGLAGALDILCAPGFSTRDEADLASGRGVGMAVVRNTVQELGGTLALWSEPGRGSRFTVELPLTLAIVDALIVSAGGQTFAMPQPSVREVAEVQPSAVTVMEPTSSSPIAGACCRCCAWRGSSTCPRSATVPSTC